MKTYQQNKLPYQTYNLLQELKEERFLDLDLIFPQNWLIDFRAIKAFYYLHPLSIFHSTFLIIMQRDRLVQVHKKYEFKRGSILDIYSLFRTL